MTVLFERGVTKPARIEADAVIEFFGPCEARFRLQHTRDFFGGPDDLLWSDVSTMSDASQPPFTSEQDLTRFNPFGVLVDVVQVYERVFYRKANAEWIRVVPFDPADQKNVENCSLFAVTCSEGAYGNAG